MEELINNLKEIGMNSYEAKVYLALLKKYPATGYEVAKLADIPQARAYDTLKSLENENIVTSSATKPVTYSPIKPKELTKRLRRKMTHTLDFLDKKLPNVRDNHIEPVHGIDGNHQIRARISELIKSAKHEIFLEIWAQDFKFFEQDLLDAYNRGLDIKIVGYDDFRCNFGTVFLHSNSREIEHAIGGKMIFIEADNSEGLFGTLSPSNKNLEPSVLWTENPEIVFLIKEFIVHDMYLIDIGTQFPEQLRYFYGHGMKKLKDKVLGGTNSYKIH